MKPFITFSSDIIHRSQFIANIAKCSGDEALGGVVRMIQLAELFDPLTEFHLSGCFARESVPGAIEGMLLLRIIERVDGGFRLSPGVVPGDRASPAVRGESVVYFVAASGLVKIGVTTNLESRLRSLRTGNGGHLDLLTTAPGTAKEEAALHARFAAHRRNGEWFEFVPELRDLIDEVQDTGRLP